MATIPYTVSGGDSIRNRFYIVRHGQTLLNSLDRAQGWADSPLTEAGKQMVADIGQKLKGIDFDAVYTSDMLRAI